MNAIRIPGIPEDSRFAYEPEAVETRLASELQIGDKFVYRASPKSTPATVEVVRIETLHRSGSTRLWAYRAEHNRSMLTPFNAGTYGPDARVEIP